MLDDQQRNFVVDAVKEDQRYADDDVWQDEEASSAVSDAIMQRMEQLAGKRQIVLLEDDPTYSFKDATS